MTAPRVIPALTPNCGTPLTLFPNRRLKAAAVGLCYAARIGIVKCMLVIFGKKEINEENRNTP